jgi:hypothetical protein
MRPPYAVGRYKIQKRKLRHDGAAIDVSRLMSDLRNAGQSAACRVTPDQPVQD